ncbi:hypothetical protein [Salinibacter phage M31CR41-2]|uniref:Outer membrane protein beta-barrel domain-containing protein n=2 Tax=Kairosalinivirus TaxID=2560158 RepID=A0A2I6UH88_9CAUD|nr:hypothetical protein FGG68_gp71 [Salinibacter phage M31CR41-2]YP_009639628.1 hypothetical protein FGG69_gp16 [Salinibacter phage SRUTV-1]ATU47015.1 hypothetical protein [Salinibacter phage SRUTV-1]AUO79287.1 hypothetical protein [Salinibacter phage M31CR41-2]AUO79356.1 hypothetical protein [Salinibacter virus M31CR41-3]
MNHHEKARSSFNTVFGAIAAAMLLVGLLSTCSVKAQDYDVRLGATFASEHYVEGDFNERNPGVFLSGYRTSGPVSVGAGVGVYDNSFSKASVTAAFRFRVAPSDWVSLGLDIGGVTGYSDIESEGMKSPAGLEPLVVPSIRVGPPEARFAVMNIGAAIGFGFTLNLTELR